VRVPLAVPSSRLKKRYRLFGALEVAIHATLFPADGLTGINDVGTARNQCLHGMPIRRTVLHHRESFNYRGLIEVAPGLFNAALVSRLNSLGMAGAPMKFTSLMTKTMVRYMKSHEGSVEWLTPTV
jgi:hypothetical protein